MDQPGLDVREHRLALTALGRANVVSFTGATLWGPVRELSSCISDRPFRILDIACGGGHVVTALARRAVRDGVDVDIVACDLSLVAIDYARAAAANARVTRVRFVQADALRGPMPADADVVLCSLFLHHLTDDEAVALLEGMAAVARHMVVVSDLRRSRLGYLFAWVGCRLLSRSRVFHADGTRSVEAAFTAGEARSLAERAGLTGAKVTKNWPERWMLTWRRPA
ncbi:MAG: methyltransferase domain-containing protein [Acidobacteria bacterium]|nr:methyltransferase domain-containing protein [Acidobacteriota bacterium]